MRTALNNGNPHGEEGPGRRDTAGDPDQPDDRRVEPHAESDEAPEEAGYGYGV
jgi:hypothetical protein